MLKGSIIMKITGFLKKYSHAWVFLYGLIYMPWFLYLENHVSKDYYLIHSPLDDYIPFIEYFIVPYLLWFVFIAVIVGYFFFTNKKGFYRLCAFMFTGMTIFLIVCTVFPNGLDLRPDTLTRDNIFTNLVRLVYAADTPTNVLPSIHVFNTLSVIFAVAHDEGMKNRKRLKGFIYIFGTLIILSTMFLKQHSVTDVFAAMVMAGIIYPFVYVPARRKAPKLSHQPI